jgi:20S proteasome alpha/beta subunit
MMKFPLFLTTSLAFSFLKGLVSATSVSHPVFDSHRHKLRSTGTTIAGVCLPSGVLVLGADTRATDDRIVADKYCSKIHFLANGIYACGAGTSGDLGE